MTFWQWIAANPVQFLIYIGLAIVSVFALSIVIRLIIWIVKAIKDK